VTDLMPKTKSKPKKLSDFFALRERVDAEVEFQKRVAAGMIKPSSLKQYRLWSDNVLKNATNQAAKFKGTKNAIDVILKLYLESPSCCSVNFATFVEMFHYDPQSYPEKFYWIRD
jgi:hypothetical protein